MIQNYFCGSRMAIAKEVLSLYNLVENKNVKRQVR